MSDNDNAIIGLQEQVEKKLNAIKDKKRFAPITNCSLELDGARYNLHALDTQTLSFLLVKLSLYADKAKALGVNCVVSGFDVKDWLSDVKARYDQAIRAEESRRLNTYATKLSDLLSSDAKTAQEIAAIAKELGL